MPLALPVAVLAGVVLGAAEAGAVVVLDGLATSVAALAVVAVNPAVQAHLVAGQASREFAHGRVLTEMGLEAANLGVQVVLIAGWVIYPGIGVVGILFAVVWLLIVYLRAEVLRRQERGLLPGQQTDR